MIGGGEDCAMGAAGGGANVTQTFQPSGRALLSNGASTLKGDNISAVTSDIARQLFNMFDAFRGYS
jgi:hypothetical protein